MAVLFMGVLRRWSYERWPGILLRRPEIRTKFRSGDEAVGGGFNGDDTGRRDSSILPVANRHWANAQRTRER